MMLHGLYALLSITALYHITPTSVEKSLSDEATFKVKGNAN
jgi:hypothetical protein